MTGIPDEDIQHLKTEHIAALIEQTLLNTVLTVLCYLNEQQQQRPLTICYKTDCPMRNVIPF